MKRRFVPGALVEHASQRWRVERPLGADAVLLRDETGEVVSADPAHVAFPDDLALTPRLAPSRMDELRHMDADWETAARRRDLVGALAALPQRTRTDVDRVGTELGVKRRRVYALVRQVFAGGNDADVRMFLPARPATRAKRLTPEVEAVVVHAIEQHYAKPARPNLRSLVREVDGRCGAAGLSPPSYKAVEARVRARDQQWLKRRREEPGAAHALRLLTGAHPGADAPWARVQIDSTPCDIRLVCEEDRIVIGRSTVTIALDLYSRVIPGFSVLLEAASTVTVATCLAHACLPKDDWLARRDLAGVRWPVWGKPAVLEHDQGPENIARGLQRGLRLHGITSKARPKGHPEHHGYVERVIGTMMRIVHEWPGTTFSDVNERGEAEPDRLACLTLPELERALALAIDGYNHTVHEGIGERPMDRYLAYYRRPGLQDAERVPPLLRDHRLLLGFLPFETRALARTGLRLFRVDYSSRDLVPLWKRDNGRCVPRIVAYDPRSLAQVWLVDEANGEYIGVSYRVPHPDMTLAESEEARRRLQTFKAEDRTEQRLFENVVAIRAITAGARSETARCKAERSRQARQGAREGRAAKRTDARLAGARAAPAVGENGQLPVPAWDSAAGRATKPPPWSGQTIAPFSKVERL